MFKSYFWCSYCLIHPIEAAMLVTDTDRSGIMMTRQTSPAYCLLCVYDTVGALPQQPATTHCSIISRHKLYPSVLGCILTLSLTLFHEKTCASFCSYLVTMLCITSRYSWNIGPTHFLISCIYLYLWYD